MGGILTIILVAAPFLIYDWLKEWNERETAKVKRIVDAHFEKGEFIASDGTKIARARWRIAESFSGQIMEFISRGRASELHGSYAIAYGDGRCSIQKAFDRDAEKRDGAAFAYKLNTFNEIEFLDFDDFLAMRPGTAEAVISAMLPDAVDPLARAVCRRIADNCQLLNLCGRSEAAESRCLR